MLSDIDRDALADMRGNIARAMQFVQGLDLESFLTDIKSFYAATRCLEIISEASRKLSPAFKDRFPEIPWKDIAGSGNIYRHNNEDVLERRLRQTIHVADLHAALFLRLADRIFLGQCGSCGEGRHGEKEKSKARPSHIFSLCGPRGS